MRWRLGVRLGVIFLGLFLCLNGIPLLVFEVPRVGELLAMGWIQLWSALMPTLGNAVFGIEGPISTMPAGSSDMTWNYVQEFWYLVIAAVGAIGCAAYVRRQSTYDTILGWFRIIVRYSLAQHMFSYGLIKVFGRQMALDPLMLERTYADSSPAGLLWTFMGFSPTYQAFAGLAEVMGAVLLLSRRTTTLGALILIGVLANVAMMNFCFDVPVKIYSSFFLLSAVFLAAPDVRRILDVFVRNRGTDPVDHSAPRLGRGLGIARVVAKAGFVLLVSWWGVEQWQQRAARLARADDRPAFHGVWDVDQFELEGEPQPGELRWRRLLVAHPGMAMVHTANGERRRFSLEHDAANDTLTLTRLDVSEPPRVLAVARLASDELVLTGPPGPGRATIHLRRRDTEHAYILMRGFHWVQEVPDTR
ncbi:hypothetical protein [Nannocystis bainbridge]|uniref:DoxX family protein n=1 Tax=Nannocystis bainbridge TaxID=2995303 RepID=A0ABT5EA57_9BACT|nr:hypothetical protein [Nannocystis bainbridge]MDC0721757.1 hypothetical protein [Nannocystis bainbridge]